MTSHLRATGLVLLTSLICAVPAMAAPRKSGYIVACDFNYRASVIHHLDDALDELSAAQGENSAMLLPAVQKVRDAAARALDGCSEKETTIDLTCALNSLKGIVLDEQESRGLPSMLRHVATGMHFQTVPKAQKNVAAMEGGENFDVLLDGILIGLNDWLKENGATAQTREHILLARQVGAVGPESP